MNSGYPLFLLLIILFTSCNKRYDHDVIIVGGGLAGLAAARELNSDNVLVLEKDSVLGGRVRTVSYQDRYYYDLGAVFALDSTYRDEIPVSDREIIQHEDIGFWVNGQLYTGPDVVSCLVQIPGLDTNRIRWLAAQTTLDAQKLDSTLLALLNTNIKAVFPAAIYQYNIRVQPFAWVRYNSSHFEHGNQVVRDYLLRNNQCKFQLQTTVNTVTDKKDHVEVIFTRSGRTDTLTARKVIVATTATVAGKLITQQSDLSRKFLDGVTYAGYYSVTAGIPGDAGEPNIAYLMPVGTGFSSVLKQKTFDKKMTIFQLYIAEEDFSQFKDTTEIRLRATELISRIWNIRDADILFYQSHFWKEAGVVINGHYLKKWDGRCLQPSPNVYLAGDYCSFDFGIPYGMIPAMYSGKKAGQMVLKQ